VLAARRTNRRLGSGRQSNDRHGHALMGAAAPTGSPIDLMTLGRLGSPICLDRGAQWEVKRG